MYTYTYGFADCVGIAYYTMVNIKMCSPIVYSLGTTPTLIFKGIL